MALELPGDVEWAARCAADGEFCMAARYWTGGLVLETGVGKLALRVDEGVVKPGAPANREGVVTLTAPQSLWSRLLAPVPPPFFNDLGPAQALGMQRSGDRVVYTQYFAAIMRAIELLRPAGLQADPIRDEAAVSGTLEQQVGRYVHLNLEGHDYRVYFEEAGQGIPMLLQHTAGAHGSQWRHLFDYPEITSRFRLIAYDLPYHGKSLPPVSKEWWSQEYRLRGEFLRSVPLALSDALNLRKPVFMGCSVGGLLALDLAAAHPNRFRAVISLAGALKIGGDLASLREFWHPRVSGEYKARLMNGLMAPVSPAAYRKETTFVYSSCWPPAFLGDLHYYIEEFDLHERAGDIDTNQVGVHILSGEYDYSGTPDLGRAAHKAIPGSTFQLMRGMGHFPMSENPEKFVEYLRPVLDRIERTG